MIPLTQRNWEETTAIVIACDRKQILPMRGGLRRFQGLGPYSHYYAIAFEYWAQGTHYISDFTAYEPHEPDSRFPILYDPANPQRNSRNDPRGDNTATVVITLGCMAAALLFLLFRAAAH